MIQAPSEAPPHRRIRRTRLETRPIRGNLALSAGLLVAFTVYTLLVVNWSPFISWDYYLNRNFHVHQLWPVLHILDRVGQRAFCLPALGVVILVLTWRHRSPRPVLIAALGVFLVNLLVLIAKLALSRGAPMSGESFFGDGDLYPSGHTSNVVVVYGLGYYFITHYGRVGPVVRRILIALLCVLPLIMFCTSLLLRWHWFSDLVGGYLIGGAVLALTVGIDAAIPFRSHKLVVVPPHQPERREPVATGRAALVGVTPRRTRAGWPTAAGDRRPRR
jgi:undecaprenyl-diphosphatase